MDHAIEVDELVVVRGGRRLLHGLTCAVPPGTRTGLLGPSGAAVRRDRPGTRPRWR